MELLNIQRMIFEIRGQQVLLDFDLAKLYGTQTKRLKEAVRRNRERFPKDFMFELSQEEYIALRTQSASLKPSGRGRHSKYPPFAFNEQGVAMLSGVLNTPKAIETNIQIIRAFVFLRKYALSHKELMVQLKELEKKYDRQFKDVFDALNYLLNKDIKEKERHDRKRIGFKS